MLLVWRHAGQIGNQDSESQSLSNHLHRLVVPYTESGAKDLVPPDDLIQSAFERIEMQLTAHANCDRYVVKRIAGLQLVQEPEPLLRERKRHCAGAWHGLNCKTRPSAWRLQRFHPFCQFGHR